LLRNHTAGDVDALGELFGRHQDRLWAVAVRTLGDPQEAADALQDAMIAVFRKADGFRGESAVTTWLHKIVVNAALDRMRRSAARPATACQDEDALDTLATGGQSLKDPSDSSDTAIDVRAALQQLAPEQHAALVLVDMLGYPVADAAQVLGVSEGTVKSRAARGRARLRPRLAHLRAGALPEPDRRNEPCRLAAPTNCYQLVRKAPTTGGYDPAAQRPAYQRRAALGRWNAAEAGRNVEDPPADPPGRAGAKATRTSPTTGAACGGHLLVLAVGQAERDSLPFSHAGRSQADHPPSDPARAFDLCSRGRPG
jgi:RNA polymerase sigma-70 factor (ECF subfamily)